MLLRQCLDDVKLDIAKKQLEFELAASKFGVHQKANGEGGGKSSIFNIYRVSRLII